MLKRMVCVAAVGGLLLGAAEPEKYTIREHLTVGDVLSYSLRVDQVMSATTRPADDPAKSSEVRELKKTETVVAEKDGLPTAMRVDVDAGSLNTYTDGNGVVKKVPNSYAGKTVTFQRMPDGSVTNDFQGTSNPIDLPFLARCITPDERLFPDLPVAVGDKWDASDKTALYHKGAKGKQFKTECRLDAVRMIDGKPMAQINVSGVNIGQISGKMDISFRESDVLTIDVNRGLIVYAETYATITFSSAADPSLPSGVWNLSSNLVMAGYEDKKFAPTTQPSAPDGQ